MISPVICFISLCTGIRAIKVIGQDVTVTAGDDAPLFCQVADTIEPITSITWQRRTKKKPADVDFFVISKDGKEQHFNELRDRVKFTGNILGPNGSIVLSNVTLLDEGIFTCIFNVFPSGPYEAKVRLSVQVPPIVDLGTDVPAVVGNTGKIFATCTAANAKPAADVSWSLGVLNDSLTVKTEVAVDSEGTTTVKSNIIGNATKNLNQKTVECLVKHPSLKEKTKLNYTLNIHYPPQLVYIILAADHEQTGKFQCEADANPKPTIFTWSRQFPVKEPLSTGLNNQLTPDSNGFYYCVVSNQHGDAVGSLNVQVTSSTCQSCWTAFIIVLFVGVGLFLIWKFHLHRRLWKILRPNQDLPTGTGCTEEEEENHCGRKPENPEENPHMHGKNSTQKAQTGELNPGLQAVRRQC